MIRTMKWWDLGDVLTIEQQVFGPTAWSPETYWAELARDDRYYVVADEAEVLGYAGLWLMPPDADVQTIAVAPNSRGRGIGSQLLEHLVGHARAAGARRLQLEVKAGNDEAIALYRRFGFEVLRLRPRYYPDFTDALVMEVGL